MMEGDDGRRVRADGDVGDGYPQRFLAMPWCQGAYVLPLQDLELGGLYSCCGPVHWTQVRGFVSQVTRYDRAYVLSVRQGWQGVLDGIPEWAQTHGVRVLQCQLEVYVSSSHQDMLLHMKDLRMEGAGPEEGAGQGPDTHMKYSRNQYQARLRSLATGLKARAPHLRLAAVFASLAEKGVSSASMHIHGSYQLYARVAGEEISWTHESALPALFGYWKTVYERVQELVGPAIVSGRDRVWCVNAGGGSGGMLGCYLQQRGYQTLSIDALRLLALWAPAPSAPIKAQAAQAIGVGVGGKAVEDIGQTPSVLIWDDDKRSLSSLIDLLTLWKQHGCRFPRMLLLLLRFSGHHRHPQNYGPLFQDITEHGAYTLRQLEGWRHASLGVLPSHLPRTIRPDRDHRRRSSALAEASDLTVVCVLT